MAQRVANIMEPFATGLTVDKLVSLRRSHEKLINTALTQCEELSIINYSVPEMLDCESEKRLTWLQVCFSQAAILVLAPRLVARHDLPAIPHNDADTHRHYATTPCLQILRCHPHTIFTTGDYDDGFANVLAWCFAQPVEHVRMACPVGDEAPSGTLVHSDVHRHRYMLTNDVYYSPVRRIRLFGNESTGRSTFPEALADELDMVYVAELGRGYWGEKNGILTAGDLLYIVCEQVRRERQIEADHYLIRDTSPLTTLFYVLDQYGYTPQELYQLTEREYSLVVLRGTEFPFVQDGTRQREVSYARQQVWYEQELSRRNIPHPSVSDSLQERLGRVLHHLPD